MYVCMYVRACVACVRVCVYACMYRLIVLCRGNPGNMGELSYVSFFSMV